MTVRELIAQLQAMPQDMPLIRKTDEFGTHVDVGGAPRVIRVMRLQEGQFGDYATLDRCDGWYKTVGEAIDVVEIDG
jgi:hypothetical protein